MSTRAYKLIEIKTEESPSFNCSNDNRIMDIAYDYNENGMLEIRKEEAETLKEELEDELKEVDGSIEEKEELERQIKRLEQIIIDCKDEESINYYCY